MTPFDGKSQNLQKSVFTFLISAKVQPVRTIATHTQADRETAKATAIGEIADLPKNITAGSGQR